MWRLLSNLQIVPELALYKEHSVIDIFLFPARGAFIFYFLTRCHQEEREEIL